MQLHDILRRDVVLCYGVMCDDELYYGMVYNGSGGELWHCA